MEKYGFFVLLGFIIEIWYCLKTPLHLRTVVYEDLQCLNFSLQYLYHKINGVQLKSEEFLKLAEKYSTNVNRC